MIKKQRVTNTFSNCKRGWYIIGGNKFYFRSLWEANYALYLNYLKQIGKIKDWSYEKDTFWFENIRRGIRSYTPDFKITNNDGNIHYEEVKGWMNSMSKTKIKRLAKYYPKVKLVLVDEKKYNRIKLKLGKELNFFDGKTKTNRTNI